MPVVAETIHGYTTDRYGRARLILAAPSALKPGPHEVKVATAWVSPWCRGLTYSESLPACFTVAEFALPEEVAALNQTVVEMN